MRRIAPGVGLLLLGWLACGLFGLAGFTAVAGCAEKDPPYGAEARLKLGPGARPQVWAVAPAINLSGEEGIDPLLQADILFGQMQHVRGVTAVPVNRTAQVFAALGLTHVRGQADAELVCRALGADGLVVPTITAYDPYDPPKVGASLALFLRGRAGPDASAPLGVDYRDQVEQATPAPTDALPPADAPGLIQATGYYDAANGSVRHGVGEYAAGRYDPLGPAGVEEYYLSADRYCGWVYTRLLEQLINDFRRETVGKS